MGQKELARCLKALDLVALACFLGVMLAIVPARCAALAATNPELSQLVAFGWAFIVATALPMIGVAVNAWKIFTQISADNSFCVDNATRLVRIGAFSIVEACLFIGCIAALAMAKVLADGLLAVLLVAVVASGGLGIVAFALSHLTAKAAVIKDENDLTV